MDAIEKAIRNAFEKGDAEDRAYREKVYRSAFAALDRALQANSGITVEKAIARRRNLQAKIAIIESEFLPAVRAAAGARRPEPAEDQQPPAPDIGSAASDVAPAVEPVQSVSGAAAAPSVTPPIRNGAPEADGYEAESVVPGIAGDPGAGWTPELDRDPLPAASGIEEVAPDRNEQRLRERRRPYGSLLLAVTLLSAIAIGGWWAYQTGLLGFSDVGGSVPNPPQIVEGEDFAPGEDEVPPPVTGEAAAPRNWVNVFSPSDPSRVNVPAGASAEVMQDESGSFLRVRSGGAGVVFDVGQGILEQLAGRAAVFDIVARAEEGKDTQMSVDCDFGELGDCGRKRYEVGYERGEYLFEVDLPDNEPGAAGSIAINSDFDGQGKAVDIYEIRVSAVE